MSNPGGGFMPRFKGIENFLRRIAFNLGNSPSQTEVKIISCIPIDVTDLQNKIIELEKELDEKQEKSGAFVNTALVEPFTIKLSARSAATSNLSDRSSLCAQLPPPPSRLSAASLATPRPCHSINVSCNSRLNPQPANGYTDNNKKSLEVLHKLRKMHKKKSKGKTQMVYYAQTNHRTPFNTIHEERNVDSKRWPEEDEMSRSYLEDVVRRQYQPERVELIGSPSSRFSSPVCRDEPQPPALVAPAPLDSDICSCCHGHFHNLDTTRHAEPLTTYPASIHRDHSIFYDSSLYDVIPVKEGSTKVKNQENSFESRRNKCSLDCDSFPEKFRTQPRYQPYVINYTTNTAPYRPVNKLLYKRKMPIKSVHKREHVIRAMQKRRLDRQVSGETSQSYSVNCGEVYMKPFHPKSKGTKIRETQPPPPPPPPSPPPILHKNAECLTMSVNDTECQTATSRSVQLEPPPLEEDRTEITLNQIKSILHAVLIEVKTNSQVKNSVEDKPMKDAVVQKGQSQSNMAACSSFMNSYSYSPYNIGPYGASCSGQMTASQTCYPPAQATPPAAAAHTVPFPHMKCLQNYPLFIQTTGRQCACCFRNMSGPTRAPAAHTATNTDSLVREQRSKETEKLIKEIYKSLAINMTYPAKESSTSDYGDLKSDDSRKKFEFKISNRRPDETRRPKIAEVSSEIRRPSEDRKTAPTPLFESKAFSGQAESQGESFPSELVSNTTTTTSTGTASEQASGEGKQMKPRVDPRVFSLLTDRELQSTGSERAAGGAASQYHQVHQARGSSPSEEDTDTPVTSDTDSEATVVDVEKSEKKEKKGLFSKMVKLFTSRPRRRRKKNETSSEPEQEEASDSDDYETVVSQQIDKRVRQRARREPTAAARRRPHSKVSYSRYHGQRREPSRRDPQRPKRSPYMEQEYRRHWNENLTFNGGDKRRYSSERPYSRESDPWKRRAPFWNEYEARAAMLQRYPPHPGYAPPPYPVYAPPPAQGRAYHQPQVKQEPMTVEKKPFLPRSTKSATKGLAWLKKHKLGIHCGEQWKRLILDG